MLEKKAYCINAYLSLSLFVKTETFSPKPSSGRMENQSSAVADRYGLGYQNLGKDKIVKLYKSLWESDEGILQFVWLVEDHWKSERYQEAHRIPHFFYHYFQDVLQVCPVLFVFPLVGSQIKGHR